MHAQLPRHSVVPVQVDRDWNRRSRRSIECRHLEIQEVRVLFQLHARVERCNGRRRLLVHGDRRVVINIGGAADLAAHDLDRLSRAVLGRRRKLRVLCILERVDQRLHQQGKEDHTDCDNDKYLDQGERGLPACAATCAVQTTTHPGAARRSPRNGRVKVIAEAPMLACCLLSIATFASMLSR